MGILIESVIQMLPPDSQIVCKYPTMNVQGIKRLEDLGSAPDQRILYVSERAEPDCSFAHSNINLMLYLPAEMDASWVGQSSNLMVIHDRRGYQDTLQQVIDTLSMQSALNDFSNDMLNILRSSGDVRSLLKYAYDLLNNPLMLVDVSFHYIDSVGTDGLLEVNWSYAVENKVFPLNYIQHIMRSYPDGGRLNPDDIRIEPKDEITSATQYSLRITRSNVVLGYLKMLEKNKPVTEFDLQVFRQLSCCLSLSNMGEKRLVPFTDSLSDNFLRALLDGTLTDKNEILFRQSIFNIKLYEILYVIVITFDGAASTNDQIYYTLHKIKSFFSGNIVTWFDNRFVVLYDAKSTDNIWDAAWTGQLSNLLMLLKCTANFSIPFKFLPDLNSYYQQANFCIELRNLFHNSKPILRYEDVFEYHMIMNLGKQTNLMDLIHPAVATLMKLEGSDHCLLETLFAYNRNHCNISTTAKEMFLHYNTMKHRISRIAERTNFTGKDSRDFFLIQLSEKILEVCQHQMENRTSNEKNPI